MSKKENPKEAPKEPQKPVPPKFPTDRIEKGEKPTIPKIKASCQHCISVMRVNQLKLSSFAPNKLYDGRIVNCSETPHYAYT